MRDTDSRWEKKDVFTTGEVAEICGLSQQTIIRSFDKGLLGGYRVPGSRARRIPRDELVRFLRVNGIVSNELLDLRRRVLVCLSPTSHPQPLLDSLTGDSRIEVKCVRDGFEIGLVAGRFQPHLVILDSPLARAGGLVARLRANADLEGTRIVLVGDEVDRIVRSGQSEIDGFLTTPIDADEGVHVMERLLFQEGSLRGR